MSESDRLTPARRQYLALKKKHPDALLLFRMGDFYELFDEDAVTAARDLHITLTSREFGRGNRVPMAGVPHHALGSYLRRLLAKGHRVAIGEQLSEPGRGLVDRDVVRVLSPGTVVEPGLLAACENNYLVSLNPGREATGLAYVDVSTGEFAVTEFAPGEDAALAAELSRLAPAECLAPEGYAPVQPPPSPCPLTLCPPRWFHPTPARERLLRHFGVATLEPFGCEGMAAATGAAAAVLAYVEGTNRVLLRLLRSLRAYSTAAAMTLDASTRRNLELTRATRSGDRAGSLLAALDHTCTAMGGRMLRRWLNRPLQDVDALNARLDVVEALTHAPARRGALRELLERCGDLERLAGRARQGIATPRDLLALAAGLRAAAGVQDLLESPLSRPLLGTEQGLVHAPSDPERATHRPTSSRASTENTARRHTAAPGGDMDRAPHRAHTVPPLHKGEQAKGWDTAAISHLTARIDPAHALADLIERAVSDQESRPIRPGFDAELDELVATVSQAQRTLLDIEARERERTGIRSLKVSFNKVFGYYIEVTKANLKHVPPDFLRRQTLANGERFVTPELKEWEARILRAEERIEAHAREVFARIVEAAGARVDQLLTTAEALAELDVLATFAELAVQRRYVRPVLDTSTALEISNGRHPVVELALEDGAFVANDVLLGAGTTTAYGPDDQSTSHAAFPTPNSPRVLLITGPNMAGKSTYLRQAALIVLLAQVGCFVPASRARIGLVDRIFTRVGAQDDLTAGASTFLVEMAETAAILRHATHRSLLVLDEIGRGTSTFDGLAIAQAVIEDVHDRIGARTLFATHFHELPALAERLHRIQNLNAAAVEENGRVVFLRRIVPGSADRSYGIHVARLAGLPEHVTARAAALLTRLENEARRSQHQEALPVPHITERHATFTPAQEECPTCATERAAHTMASLRSVNLAATTPIEALNLLFSLQETLTAAVPCRHRATGTRLAVVEPPHEPGAWWRGAGTSAPGTPS